MPKGSKGQEAPRKSLHTPAKAIESWDNEGGAPSTGDRSCKKGGTRSPSPATSLNTRAQSAKCTCRMRTARSARDANQFAQSYGFDWREWFVLPIPADGKAPLRAFWDLKRPGLCHVKQFYCRNVVTRSVRHSCFQCLSHSDEHQNRPNFV